MQKWTAFLTVRCVGMSQPFFVQHYDTSRFLTQIRFADKGEERYNKVTGNRSAS